MNFIEYFEDAFGIKLSGNFERYTASFYNPNPAINDECKAVDFIAEQFEMDVRGCKVSGAINVLAATEYDGADSNWRETDVLRAVKAKLGNINFDGTIFDPFYKVGGLNA